MKVFKKPKTKSLAEVLRELEIGGQVVVDNRQSKIPYVRKLVSYLNKRGFTFTASEKGLVNKILVTRIK